MSPRTKLALMCLLVLAALAYGVVAGRYRLFPYFDALFAEDGAPAAGTDAPAEPEPEPDDARRGSGKPRRGSPLRRDIGRGFWHVARADGLTDEERRELAEVAVLPYAAGVKPAGGSAGVTVHEPGRAWPGLNFVTSGHAPEALLVTMDGEVLHRWRCPFRNAFPGPRRRFEGALDTTYWRRAHLLPGGGILAIFEGIGMVELGPESQVLWTYRGRPHHDIHVHDDGTIWTLTRRVVRRPPDDWLEGPIIADYVTVLGPDGEELRRVSVLACIERSKYVSVLGRRKPIPDILHSNTIELLDGRHAERYPMLQKGHVLVSVRNLDMLCVIDPDREVVTWAMTDLWREQHQPTVLGNGHLLVFDNQGNRGKSRVLEVDPLTHEIAWSYDGTPEQPLESFTLGACQRLPNGNTLITESEPGRALEVTPGGDVVWEFVNPFRAGPNGQLIASLFEVVRIDPNDLLPAYRRWLDERR